MKNIACGLCGTDISFFKATTGTNSAFEPIPGSKRTYLGHENVGVITEVGKDVTEFKVGDRVTIRAYMAGCDTKGLKDRCEYCKRGDYNFAFLDEGSKREIRRAVLHAIAVPGYQVPFGSRELPIGRGWGTGGIQLTMSLIGPDDTLKSSTRQR